MAVAALGSSGRGQGSWWLILLLLLAHSNGRAQAAPTKTAAVAGTTTATAAAQQLQIGVEGDTPTLMAAARQQYVSTVTTAAAATAAATDAAPATRVQPAATTTVAPPPTTTTVASPATTTTFSPPATTVAPPTTTVAPPATTTTVAPPTTTVAPPATTTTVAPPATTAAPPTTTTAAPPTTTAAPPAITTAAPPTTTVAPPAITTTTGTIALVSNSSTDQPATTASSNTMHLNHQQSLESVVQLLDLELTEAPPINKGHDGLKFTKKKQLQQQQFHITTTTTPSTTTIEAEVERIPTTTTIESSQPPVLMPVPNGYLGPIFMGERIFSVVHPPKQPQPVNHQQPLDSIESQLREGRLVEILAPTALLESGSTTSRTTSPTTTTTTTTHKPQAVLSTTVFQVPEPLVASTTRLPMAAAEISVATPPRTESKISDIQIEVYDSTVDSIVASTNFRDNQGSYPLPLEPALGTTKPPSSPVAQERFTQYVIDRADVSTQPADPGVGKPEPAAIEIHINVSEAFGNESEDLEFSYRQPPNGDSGKPSKINDEILVVEIIDSSAADNSTENVSSNVSSERLSLNPMQFNYPYRSDDRMTGVEPPAVRPPQPQDADELFMADRSGGALPRPPHPPPPPPMPMPRKPSIDRDSDTIFYISNTEVKVGESLPTTAANEQQRKQQLENQFFPASYVLDQQRSSSATPRYEEDIILSPLHNTADALKILRSPSPDGAPPLDVTYVGESVIEVEQQSFPSTSLPLNSMSSPQPDIVIQPAVLPDLAIGVPVIGELPPQIELKEIDYMPGELVGQSQGIYENDIESNSLGMGNDPDVAESSIQYGGDLIDDGAGGGFDGVEGSYPFDSPAHRLQQQQRPLGPRFSHLHREQQPVAELLNATLEQRNESTADLGGASAMAPLQHGGNQLLELKAISVHSSNSDNPLADYFNLIAVSVGLSIVVLAAGLLTSMYCAVRYFLNKNTTSIAAGDDSEQGQGQDSKLEPSSICSNSIGAASSSSSPASQLSNPQDLHSNPNQNQNQNPNPNPNPNPNAALIRSMSLALASGVQRIEFQFETRSDIQNTPNATASGATTPTFAGAFAFSGSVTKMTLKDNHLIVVTEERHDISRNARETKMHTDKDGVFVVEVARGIDSKQPPDSPANGVDTTELPFDTMHTKQAAAAAVEDRSLPPSHEQVQIHAPPSDFANPLAGGATVTATATATATGLHLIEEEPLADEDVLPEEGLPLRPQAATGLSQSDLSSTSSSDSNKRYSYGNQELYVFDQPGYVTNAPTVLSIPLVASEEVTEQEQQIPQLKAETEKESEKQLEQSEKPKRQQQQESEKQPENQMEQQQKQQQKEQQIQQESEKQLENESEKQQSEMQLLVDETSVPAPAEFGNVEESRDEAKEETNEATNEFTDEQNKEETKAETLEEQKPEVNASNKTAAETDENTDEEEKAPEVEQEKVDMKVQLVSEELQPSVEPESSYDSLMSLPAPPSTEEIKELSDFALMESSQLDSLPPPPPPITDNGHSHNHNYNDKEMETAKEQEKEAMHSNGNGKLATVASNGVGVGVGGGAEEPSTLTPPASPPASPTSGASLCGGGLSNGIHAVAVPMAVDVNGS